MANRNRAAVRGAVHRAHSAQGSRHERAAAAGGLSQPESHLRAGDRRRSAKTLASASTTEKDLAGKSGGNIEAAKRVGQAIAERALAAGIESVVFDRGGYLYHGRVRALTDAARAAGLNKNEVIEAEAERAEEARRLTPEAEPKKRKRQRRKEEKRKKRK